MQNPGWSCFWSRVPVHSSLFCQQRGKITIPAAILGLISASQRVHGTAVYALLSIQSNQADLKATDLQDIHDRGIAVRSKLIKYRLYLSEPKLIFTVHNGSPVLASHQ